MSNRNSECNDYLVRLVNTAIDISVNFAVKKMLEEKPQRKNYETININNCFDKITLDAVSLFEKYDKPKNQQTNICRLIEFFSEDLLISLSGKKISSKDDLKEFLAEETGINEKFLLEIISEAKKYRDKVIAHKDSILKLEKLNYPHSKKLTDVAHALLILLNKNKHILPNNIICMIDKYFVSFSSFENWLLISVP